MTVRLFSIASGSSGNCIYIGDDRTGFLVDAGISCKAILGSLKNIGICTDTIKALLVTHEHSDHIKSAGVVSRKLNIPIYANSKTWETMDGSLGKIKSENIKIFETGSEFEIENVKIRPFSTPHDAIEPVGFSLNIKGIKIGFATDLGHFSQEVRDGLKNSDFVMLESNHDVEMLKAGSYPYFLKRRIMGEHGHLSNEAAGYAACELINSGINQIMLGHLSRENNFPQLAYETVKGIMEEKGIKIGQDVILDLAPRSTISRVFMWDKDTL